MSEHFDVIRDIYSTGERFDEIQTYTDRRLKKWEEDVSRLFPRGAKVLDIGCGKGREAFCLNDSGFHVTGIDLSETAIFAARRISEEKRLNIRFDISDGMHLSFPDSSFDVVLIWSQTFGLFDTEESKMHILLESQRVLRDGGILSLSAHDREYLEKHHPAFIKHAVFHPFGENGLFYQTYTIKELKNCVAHAGFQHAECKRGMVYTKADGTILHCLSEKPAGKSE